MSGQEDRLNLKKKLDYSIVLPAYNEAETLEHAVERVRHALAGSQYEIIIAEDGSTDDTESVGRALEKKFKTVRLFHSNARRGRGASLRAAFSRARAPIVAFLDVDLSAPASFLPPLLLAAKTCEVVTGSRYVPGSRVQRLPARKLASVCFNTLVRIVLGSRLHDHQCGMKAFSRAAILKLDEQADSTRWFYDTQVLVLAQKNGMSVLEIPVEWRERTRGKSKVSLLRDSLEMFSNILSFRVKLWQLGYLY